MMAARTIAGMLKRRSDSEPDRLAVRFYERGEWVEWTWRQYWAAAESASASFREAGVTSGDHVLMLTPGVRPAVAALFGLWSMGAFPIQIGLPLQPRDRQAFFDNLPETADRLDARFLLTTPVHAGTILSGPLRILTSDGLLEATTRRPPEPDEVEGTAFIQLTSGSTSRPRGVVVPHDRLMLHMRSMSESLPSHTHSVAVSWLPLHHDMGLLGGLLFPFFNGFLAHLISTADFQVRPSLWLETMSRFRGTITAAPPSAYAICVQLADRLRHLGLDLGAWKCAMVGAEPVPPTLFDRFANAFAPTGFRRNAFFPVYGLAEATVAVTFPALLREPRLDRVDRAALGRESRAVPSNDLENSAVLTGVGAPISGTQIRITGPGGATLRERLVGEVQVSSPSLALGYYGDPDATSAAFQDGWLRTGDLGYVADGALFITGRQKEIIIKGGQNLIPSLLEEIVAAVPGVRSGAVAAVGLRSPVLETEMVCIAAETRCEPPEHPALAERIRTALATWGIAVDRIFLLPPKCLPKTSSGKPQRVAIAQMLDGRAE
jgi:acyl-CoA synthetase (AMP-forming)/AMP-acid ligase II